MSDFVTFRIKKNTLENLKILSDKHKLLPWEYLDTLIAKANFNTNIFSSKNRPKPTLDVTKASVGEDKAFLIGNKTGEKLGYKNGYREGRKYEAEKFKEFKEELRELVKAYK